MSDPKAPTLLSIDLEDVRDFIKDGHTYADRLLTNVNVYLDLFKRLEIKATFFVVGKLARRYPELIEKISTEGHELACHGDQHIQLDRLSPAEFERDLGENLKALSDCGIESVYGFRAPTFSLVQSTSWVYSVLENLGFTYSSSVLPARNPLYGWPGFGEHSRIVSAKVLEIPITLHSLPFPRVPVVGGVYFRVMPFLFTSRAARKQRSRGPLTTYLHPYDVDTRQERFMHPDLNDNRFFNWLMYRNRDKVVPRLTRMINNQHCQTYGSYAREFIGENTACSRSTVNLQTTNMI
jgi:polysaccharide deacetylase family protein (PEP-CTERM system associated)